MKAIVTVVGLDRVGIIGEICTTLAAMQINIVDISQTVMGEGEIFSMTMLVTLDTEVADFNTVQERLAAVGEDLGVQVIIQREDVFQFMYKI